MHLEISWITHFRFGCTVSELVSLECWIQNMGVAVGISSISCLGAEKHAIKVYRKPSWIFPLPDWSHSLPVSLIGKLDPKNIGMAVGISLISCLGAEIHEFEV